MLKLIYGQFETWYAEEESKKTTTIPVGMGGKYIEDMTVDEKSEKKRHFVKLGRQHQLSYVSFHQPNIDRPLTLCAEAR